MTMQPVHPLTARVDRATIGIDRARAPIAALDPDRSATRHSPPWSILALAIVFTLGVVGTADASVAEPSGTLVCQTLDEGTIKPALPSFTPSAQVSTVKVSGASNLCDHSATTGGRHPIDYALVRWRGNLPAGSSCATEFTEPPVEGEPVPTTLLHGRVRVRLLAVVPGPRDFPRYRDVGAVSAPITSIEVIEDPAYGLVIKSAPIRRGAFAGEVITLHEVFANFEQLFNECTSPTGSVARLDFAEGEPSSITIAP